MISKTLSPYCLLPQLSHPFFSSQKWIQHSTKFIYKRPKNKNTRGGFSQYCLDKLAHKTLFFLEISTQDLLIKNPLQRPHLNSSPRNTARSSSEPHLQKSPSPQQHRGPRHWFSSSKTPPYFQALPLDPWQFSPKKKPQIPLTQHPRDATSQQITYLLSNPHRRCDSQPKTPLPTAIPNKVCYFWFLGLKK